jgi:transposase InsO family protein
MPARKAAQVDPMRTELVQRQSDLGSCRCDGHKGNAEHLRSGNGPEFVARDLRKWLAATGAKTPYIKPGSSWENGYCERFNSTESWESI